MDRFSIDGFETTSDSGPAYRRLADALANAIRSGHYPSASALPTERNLANELGLARVTVRSAYAELVRLGLIEIRPGSGAYVRKPPIEQALWRLSSFTEDMAARGRMASTRLLSHDTGPASQAERSALALPDGARVVRIERLRLADDQPMALETAFVSAAILGEARLPSMEGSLYALLGQLGYAPLRGRQRLRAVALDSSAAALLGVRPDSPALLIERISFLADDRPIEFTRSLYRGDAYDFIAELNATGSKS